MSIGNTSSDPFVHEETINDQFIHNDHVPISQLLTPLEEREVVDELVVILIECLGQINTKGRTFLLWKFFSKLGNEIPFERFVREKLQRSQVLTIKESIQELLGKFKRQMDSKIVNTTTTIEKDLKLDAISTRGLHEPKGEMIHWLERFKVRTVNLDGVVVKEEEK